MRLLIDSHAFLWWSEDSPALGSAARSAIADPVNEALISVAALWELTIKASSGKLTLPADLETMAATLGFSVLSINFHAPAPPWPPAAGSQRPFRSDDDRPSARRRNPDHHRRSGLRRLRRADRLVAAAASAGSVGARSQRHREGGRGPLPAECRGRSKISGTHAASIKTRAIARLRRGRGRRQG